MKLYVFSIMDRQVGSYMTPYFLQSEGQAIRSFGDEVNRAAEDNILYKHADDFELFQLGEYDSETASFELFKVPRLVVSGGAMKLKGNGNV